MMIGRISPDLVSLGQQTLKALSAREQKTHSVAIMVFKKPTHTALMVIPQARSEWPRIKMTLVY